MKKSILVCIGLMVGLSISWGQFRTVVTLEKGWKFTRNDDPHASEVGFDDSNWQSVRVPRRARLFVLLGVGLFAAFLSQLPWLTLFALAFAYAASFPLATIAYRKRRGLQLEAAAAVRPPASGLGLPDEREGRQPVEP